MSPSSGSSEGRGGGAKGRGRGSRGGATGEGVKSTGPEGGRAACGYIGVW